jgi:hypothetical protein
MKKTALILILFIVISSCKHKYDLEGIWIGAYEKYEYNDKNKNQYQLLPLRYLIDINSDSITFKHFDYGLFQRDTVIKCKFIIDENNLIVNSEIGIDKFRIDIVNNDSIVFKVDNRNFKNRTLVFKKLDNPPKLNDLDLSNKAYSLICDNGYTDSIDFINDSILFHIGNNRFFPINNIWFINEYKGFKILVQNNFFTPPQLITYADKDLIELRSFGPKDLNIKLNLIKLKTDLKRLYGNWQEISRNNIDSVEYEWSQTYPDNKDWRLNLNISKDSIEISDLLSKNTYSLITNTTNQYICFNPFEYQWLAWKILLSDNDRLVIERYNSRLSEFSEPFEIIEFKKIKND